MSESQAIRDLTDADLGEVLGADAGAALIVFEAPWCGVCHRFSPVLERVAREREGSVVVARVDVDRHRDLVRAHRIRTVPTLVMFRDGVAQETLVGAQPRSALLALLERHGRARGERASDA